MTKIVRMRQMLDNQRGVVVKILATGEMGRRIREMGILPNVPLQIQGRAPLKDPVAVRLGDFVLTLRNNEADQILVKVDEPE
jgi:ferrous iron transport protein A